MVKDVETIRRGIDERYESWYEEKFFILRDALEAKKNNLEYLDGSRTDPITKQIVLRNTKKLQLWFHSAMKS